MVGAAQRAPRGATILAPRIDHSSRAQRILDRLDELSDNEVEELLLELEEKEVK